MKPGERTPGGWLLGLGMAVVFGAANAYLGLKAGMTVSASIPAAVVSMALLRGVLRRNSILENNIAQTIASAGESLAAGVIFTVPALLLLGVPVGVVRIFILASMGGLLGILGFALFRKQLIEEEHDRLPYPEGTACARVLESPERSREEARFVLWGFFTGAIMKGGLHVGLPSVVGWLASSFTYLAMDVSPALGAVGLILGRRIASWILVGGWIGWGVLLPVNLFVQKTVLQTPDDAYALWSSTIRYIGAGAVLAGGMVAFLKSMVSLWRVRRGHVTGGLPGKVLGIGYGGLWIGFVLLGLHPLAALAALIFGILFAGVSGRITGIVGSSSNPVSGMTIATLVMISVLLVQMGMVGRAGMTMALMVGAVVCIAAAVAGDTAQDLKTGYLVGATPLIQQVAEMVGVLVSAAAIGWVVLLLHKTYGIGSTALPAPQATLMELVVRGVFEGDLPWVLIGAGGMLALAFELLGIASLPVAVGLYLPLELSLPIFLGSLLAWGPSERRVLYASGVIAGDALVGLGWAVGVMVGWTSVGVWLPGWLSLLIWIGVLSFPLWRWKQNRS